MIIVVGGPVVVVVVVVLGVVDVVVGGPVVVVVVRVVVVVGGDFLVGVVVVVVVGDFLVVVVVVVGATVVVVMGREVVVEVGGTTGMGPSRVGADVGAVAEAALVGVLRVASNLPNNNEFTDATPGFAGVVVVVVFAGRDTAVEVEVAGAVLGAAAFVAAVEVGPLSDGGVSFCTNPT